MQGLQEAGPGALWGVVASVALLHPEEVAEDLEA